MLNYVLKIIKLFVEVLGGPFVRYNSLCILLPLAECTLMEIYVHHPHFYITMHISLRQLRKTTYE